MGSHHCLHCGNPTEVANYCDWNCNVAHAKAAGGKVVCPNGLPIMSINAIDGSMYEHEHGDHPDYKFPITVEYTGEIPDDLPDWDPSFEVKDHALIYCDGYIAITIYECSHYMWKVSDGTGSSTWRHEEWKISDTSLERIRERFPVQYEG
jgi:hypothetical protein